jgi:hypothetical protein
MTVESAIGRCRTAALGGHVACCEACAHTVNRAACTDEVIEY